MAGVPKLKGMGFPQQGEQEDQRRGTERRKTQRPEGSVVVDMEGLSLLADAGVSAAAATAPESAAAAATESPRVPMILQKTLARKFSQRGEKKTAGDGVDALVLPPTPSAGGGDGKEHKTGTVAPFPAAAAAAAATANSNSDKFVAITLSPTVVLPPETTAPAAAAAVAASSPRRTSSCKRAHGRRAASASPWLDPRRVLLFFATLSSMGTIILLYFTLSMGTIGDGGDANAR